MSSPRILQVITRSDWGGAQRIVESLATQIDEVATVACGPGGRLIERLEEEEIPTYVQPYLQSDPYLKDLLAYRDLKQLIVEGEFDIVHSHSTKAGALSRIAAARADIPTVFTVHGWGFYNTKYGSLRPLVIRGEQFLEKCTDEIVCVSENDYQQGMRQDILSSNKGTIIHNGIQPLDYSSDRNTLNERFDINQEKPIIGSIGRITPQKNPIATLRTAKKLKQQGQDVSTILIGTGPLENTCKKFINKYNMENTYIPGFVENAVDFLPDFDVFLLTSRFEGFPLTVLECMHAGVPIVAYDVGGVAEAIVNGETGFVVPSNKDNQQNQFVDRVQHILENKQQREDMGQRAKEIATTRFTERRMIAAYRDIYETVM